MAGPFSLRYLHLFVKERSAGAFILSRDGKSTDFVGKSPDDVAAALGRFTRSPYRYFWFSYVSSPGEAARLEQSWRHRYRPTDNGSAPHGSHAEHWECTIAGCAACALTQTRR